MDANTAFLIVRLNINNIKMVIPVRWCMRLNLITSVNDRLNANKKRVIFFSPDERDEPDFRLPISEKFDKLNSGCYYGHAIKLFRKYKTGF